MKYLFSFIGLFFSTHGEQTPPGGGRGVAVPIIYYFTESPQNQGYSKNPNFPHDFKGEKDFFFFLIFPRRNEVFFHKKYQFIMKNLYNILQ